MIGMRNSAEMLDEIKILDLEVTARCNAACPMCSRTFNDKILNNQGELSIQDIKKFFPVEFVQRLTAVKFCGNYGDPIVAKDLLQMHEYFLENNPNVTFILSTNGGVRSEAFWSKLGTLYASSPNSYVEWHIDGLKDTNHLYRVGVVWEKVMANAKAFIAAGGTSRWFFIPFFHNEHQVEEAEQLSKEMGFKDFVVKISARFSDPKKPYVFDGGKIYPPTSDKYNIEKMQVDGDLICFAEKRKQIYIDAWGRMFPCCWTASRYTKENWFDQKIISLRERSLNDIYQEWKRNILPEMWENKLSVCNERCTGKHQHVIEIDGKQKPQKQWWYDGAKNGTTKG